MRKRKYLISIVLSVVDGTNRYVDFYFDNKKKITNKDIEGIRDTLISDYNKDKNIVDGISILNIIYLGKVKVK